MNVKGLIPLKFVIKQLLERSKSPATTELDIRKIRITCLYANIHPLGNFSLSPEKLTRFFKTKRTNEFGER